MSQQESFEKEFSKLREMKDQFVLRGSSIIVEMLEDEEIKTAGGIVIVTDSKHVKGGSVKEHMLNVGRVLMAGPGYWNDETNEYEPLEITPGAIVLLTPFSISYISVFPGIQRPTGNKIGLVKMDSILCYYKSQEDYEQVKAKLNS